MADDNGGSWKWRFVSSVLIEGVNVTSRNASGKGRPIRLSLIRDANALEADPFPTTTSDWSGFLSDFTNAVQRGGDGLVPLIAGSFSNNLNDFFRTWDQELASVKWNQVDRALTQGVETPNSTPWGRGLRTIIDEHPCPNCRYQVMLVFTQDKHNQWHFAGIGYPRD